MAKKKPSFQIKGIKNLDKTEMKEAKAGACGYIDPDLLVICTDSFYGEWWYFNDVIAVANHFEYYEFNFDQSAI